MMWQGLQARAMAMTGLQEEKGTTQNLSNFSDKTCISKKLNTTNKQSRERKPRETARQGPR